MSQVIGNFEILEQIASGGMAVIYKARQTTLDRLVVIKELKSTFKEDSEIVARFEQEAKAVAKLQHENIITVIEFWHKEGSYYIAMEYLDGADLSRILERAGPLPLNIGLIIAYLIVRALEYAHERGIVHRDLKPSNILISRDGKVKLTDFGIAHIEEELGGKELTRAGLYMGTPAYMSPEQIDGKPTEASSDIWSFGCALYEIFSGQRAFTDYGESTMMENIRKGRKAPVSEHFKKIVPWGLRRWINRCLKVRPKKRPTTERFRAYLLSLAQQENRGKDFSQVLRSFFEDKKGFEPVEARTAVKGQQPPEARLRRKVPWPAVAAAIVVIALGAGYALLKGKTLDAIIGPAARTGANIKNSFVGFMGKVRSSFPSQAAVPSSPTVAAVAPAPQEIGYLRVVASPWAEIYIDGEKVGLTPTDKKFEVYVGKHKVRLKNPYYKTVTREVDVSKNEVLYVKADLKKGKKRK